MSSSKHLWSKWDSSNFENSPSLQILWTSNIVEWFLPNKCTNHAYRLHVRRSLISDLHCFTWYHVCQIFDKRIYNNEKNISQYMLKPLRWTAIFLFVCLFVFFLFKITMPAYKKISFLDELTANVTSPDSLSQNFTVTTL